MPESVRVRVPVAAPVATVWRALTQPEQLRRWFGWDYDGLEDEIEQIFRVGASVTEPGRVLDTNGGGRFELDFAGEGCVVRVVREDPPGGPEADNPIDAGWLTFVQQLRFMIERHPDEERATARAAGTARAGSAPLPEALGLGAADGLEPGARYAATTAFGETLAGEVWFRADRQLGLTVDAYGDGLVILHDAPPPSQASATVSTFGLPAGELAGIAERWQGWWPERHDAG